MSKSKSPKKASKARAKAQDLTTSGDIGLCIGVTLSFVVNPGFSVGDLRDREAMKQTCAELVMDTIKAAGGITPEMIDAMQILEVKDLDSDGQKLFITV